MSTAIEFNNVSKLYRLGLVSSGTLSNDLKRWWTMNILHKEDPFLKVGSVNDRSKAADSEYVWALKDIDFKVEQGDVVGIIGKNGAGKSTLLKLLSKVTAPTTGTIKAKGRIASLLEVGTGFHPELTGRENIYMNGTILGMTKAEITHKLDEIVDFSGCERYIDTPVKRYSSGMTVRLGFAVAAHLDPEILVVDEVLAVGDAEFQKKAIGKMQDVSRGEGRTVLFVSHNMNAIRNLCQRGVVLENGSLKFDGHVEDAVELYLQEDTKGQNSKIKDDLQVNVDYLSIDRVIFNGTENSQSTIKHNQRFVDVEINGYTKDAIRVDLSFQIKRMDGIPLASFSQGHFTGKVEKLQPGRFIVKRRVLLPEYLFSGDCLVDIALHDPGKTMYFFIPNGVKLRIEGNTDEYGRALEIKKNGLCGFKSITDGISVII